MHRLCSATRPAASKWQLRASIMSIRAPGGASIKRSGSVEPFAPTRDFNSPRRDVDDNLSQFGVIRLLALSVLLILPATAGAQQRPPIIEKLAKTYGLESFGQIEAIRYTFTVQSPGLDLSRSWIWEPKTDRVAYEGKDKSGKPVKVTYLHSQLGSQSAEVKDDIDPGFLNDNYWLILPFHVAWDTGATVED